MKAEKIYTELLESIAGLPANPADDLFLKSIQNWLRRTHHLFSAEIWSVYQFDFYSEIVIEAYLINKAQFEPTEEMRQLRRVPPESLVNLASRILGLFRDGLFVESIFQCPRCNDSALFVAKDVKTSVIVLECNLCAWVQSTDGQEFVPEAKLLPVPLVRLLDVASILPADSLNNLLRRTSRSISP